MSTAGDERAAGVVVAYPESTDPRGESQPLITAQRRSAASEGSTLRVRRRSTLDRASSRDLSTIIGGFRLSGNIRAPALDCSALPPSGRRRFRRWGGCTPSDLTELCAGCDAAMRPW